MGEGLMKMNIDTDYKRICYNLMHSLIYIQCVAEEKEAVFGAQPFNATIGT